MPGAWDRGYRLYWVRCEDGDRVDLTPQPYLDFLFWKGHSGFKEMALITPFLPLGIAEYLKRRLDPQSLATSKGRPLSWYSVSAAKLTGELDPERKFAPMAEKILGRAMPEAAMPSQADLDRVRSLLAGKILLGDEIGSLLDQHKLVLNGNLEHVLHLLYLKAEVKRYPAIGFQAPGFPVCNHCGQATRLREHRCEGCGGHCFYCEECLILGESRLCRALYAMPAPLGPEAGAKEAGTEAVNLVEPQLDYPLTPAQEDACRAVRSFMMTDRRQECLVWAVCGAGKTEVALAAIAQALARGQRVLYASPRREVIQELKPRLQKAFPGRPITALYGGSSDRYYQVGDLVLATTHQALRFYQAFDLVVLDEVDAFPFEGSSMLYYGVTRAQRPGSKALYLTATPPPELVRRAERRQMEVVRLPVRPHGYPLPEPQIIIERSWGSLAGKPGRRLRDRGTGEAPDCGWDGPGPEPSQLKDSEAEPLFIPPRVLNILHQSVEGDLAQVFVFVPTVYLTRRVGEALRQAMGQPPWEGACADWVQYTSAKDPKRDEKRQAFARGEFPILVCTTIMERGITIPRVNVVVLFADQERIFDQATLVQMAGRAGRSPEYPEGRVWLVGLRATASMERAVAHIRAMNAEAFTRGYLRPQYYHHRCRG